MAKPPADVTIQVQVRYQCPDCEAILDEGERRCDSCNKFGARVEILGTCPHCDEAITVEDGLS